MAMETSAKFSFAAAVGILDIAVKKSDMGEEVYAPSFGQDIRA